MIITVASQASWTNLKDVVWIIKRFIEDSSKKVSFMVNSLSRHHKVHNKYWMFKEDYEDCSWRIMMEKPASHATKRICFDVMRQNSHWVLCHILWGFTTTTNINENDAFIEDLENLLKVSCYQSLSRGESFENDSPWVFK
jgi:hypothetical protein